MKERIQFSTGQWRELSIALRIAMEWSKDMEKKYPEMIFMMKQQQRNWADLCQLIEKKLGEDL